jgi:acyl-CoA reductase-like NAD-dependent aldehyde dehydrogenase
MAPPRYPLVIGDSRVDTPEWLPVDDRATGEVIGEIAAGRPQDVDAAVQRARAALPGWARWGAPPPFAAMPRCSTITSPSSRS